VIGVNRVALEIANFVALRIDAWFVRKGFIWVKMDVNCAQLAVRTANLMEPVKFAYKDIT
jgi:hypothetical protein